MSPADAVGQALTGDTTRVIARLAMISTPFLLTLVSYFYVQDQNQFREWKRDIEFDISTLSGRTRDLEGSVLILRTQRDNAREFEVTTLSKLDDAQEAINNLSTEVTRLSVRLEFGARGL